MCLPEPGWAGEQHRHLALGALAVGIAVAGVLLGPDAANASEGELSGAAVELFHNFLVSAAAPSLPHHDSMTQAAHVPLLCWKI